MLHIFISCDENYAPHLATTIISILDNCQTPEDLCFIIGDAGLTSSTISRLQEMITCYKSNITFTYLDKSKFEGLEVKRYGLSIYFRLYLKEVIAPYIKFIVCIDCDTVVVEDITTIMDDLPTLDFTLAAVENIGRSPYKSLGLEKGKYFNCGLMLINMRYWKELNIGERALSFLREHPELCTYPEQSALNKILDGEWTQLPLAWNAQRPAYKNLEKRMHEQHRPREEFLESIQKPKMIHYMGKRSKPWEYGSLHPLKDIYFYYRAMTPWNSGVIINNKTFKKTIMSCIELHKIYKYQKRRAMSRELLDSHRC
ncbi:glycosyltransferase family 8 protein [Cobetia sp. MC34]|uniref:glycosyltransferase family 8 protein n=1 Tax=Cobetia sp. MC34 TaxID=2785080 RepID=UPI001BC8DC5B|nr:glycosyltransferase family 8 protein [Cobetia sp. MC34]MBS4154867.1 glycosyltransferase family 8 protein [Cobetia sp. MC34]